MKTCFSPCHINLSVNTYSETNSFAPIWHRAFLPIYVYFIILIVKHIYSNIKRVFNFER